MSDIGCWTWYYLPMDLYHICNRGVDKREVFLDDGDRARFVHDLYVMNDVRSVPHHDRDQLLNVSDADREREPLVHLYAWCLMPNHYHLLLSPVDDDPKNLSLFTQKVGMGYSKFFNKKYKRSGALWQGKHKKVRIQRDAHFLYIPLYIHLNPLDLSMPEWRHGRVRDVDSALEKLSAYRWSSFHDYTGVKNFPSLIDKPLLEDVLGSRKKQAKVIADIIGDGILANSSWALEM